MAFWLAVAFYKKFYDLWLTFNFLHQFIDISCKDVYHVNK